MKRKILLPFFITLMLVGCVKDNEICGCIPEPEVDQAWMDKTIAELEQNQTKNSTIVRANYEGTCVVFVSVCCMACNWAFIPYRCDGVKLENVDSSKLTNQTVIWQPEGYACS